jgi:hypothetical protein
VNVLIALLNKRQKAFQNAKWLRPTLLVVDFILLVAGLVINPVLGFILGFVFILINEFFTPMVIQKVFLREISGEIRPAGKLTKKIIRGSKSRNKKIN